MEIELRVVQFWTEIKLVITNRTPASRSCDFVITRLISVQIALHSVRLPLFIGPLLAAFQCCGLLFQCRGLLFQCCGLLRALSNVFLDIVRPQAAQSYTVLLITLYLITRCIVIGRLSKQQQAISGKRANVWGVSKWPLRMDCCCFESRPMIM